MFRIIYLLPIFLILSCCKDDISLRDDDCDECDISLDIFDGAEYEGEITIVCSNNPMIPVRNIKAKARLFKVVDSTFTVLLLLEKDSVYKDRTFQADIKCKTLECTERFFRLIHGDSLVAGNISASSNDLYFTFLDSHCDDYINFNGDKK